MNKTVIFDTHRVVKKFVSVGFTEEQAEVFAEEQKIIIENNLATKQDVVEINFKIESLKKDIELSTKKVYIVLFSSIFTSIGFFVTVLTVLQLLKL